MQARFRSPGNRGRNFRRTGALLALLTAAIFLALPSAARTSSPWKDKDWTKWTVDDCTRILTASPWASQIVDPNSWTHTDAQAKWQGATAVILSSLVVRQALARYREQDATCVTESFTDRIIVRFSGQDIFKNPPDLLVSGKKIPPLAEHRANSSSCSFGSDPGEFSYPRVVSGKPIFKNGGSKLVINTDLDISAIFGLNNQIDPRFKFSTKNMVYKGKPDF